MPYSLFGGGNAVSVSVDLNADVGESFGAYRLGRDEDIMTCITSANIACGLHAGDPSVMQETVALAARHGVAVGAHPGYPDLQGFGRRDLTMSPVEIKNCVIYQVGALLGFCRAAGVVLSHVKPHGAMYNRAARDPAVALAVAEAVKAVDPGLVLLGLAGSESVKAARAVGLRGKGEVFADRAYNPDGSLVHRARPGALIEEPRVVARRAVRMVTEGRVASVTGEDVQVIADTICLHGDHPRAVEFARLVRSALVEAGVEVRPFV